MNMGEVGLDSALLEESKLEPSGHWSKKAIACKISSPKWRKWIEKWAREKEGLGEERQNKAMFFQCDGRICLWGWGSSKKLSWVAWGGGFALALRSGVLVKKSVPMSCLLLYDPSSSQVSLTSQSSIKSKEKAFLHVASQECSETAGSYSRRNLEISPKGIEKNFWSTSRLR